jgi:hypothetical protein
MTAPLVHYQWIPAGDAGARATMAVMRQLVQDARRERWAVQVAQSVILEGPPEDVVAAIREFFEDRFQFAYDPFAMDRVTSPVLLLQELQARGRVRGDCDDAAVLAAFLGAVRGLPYKFRAVGFHAAGPLSHVFTILRVAGNPIALDVTANPKQVVPAARRFLDYPS